MTIKSWLLGKLKVSEPKFEQESASRSSQSQSAPKSTQVADSLIVGASMPNPAAESYAKAFQAALEFTAHKYPEARGEIVASPDSSLGNLLVDHALQSIPAELFAEMEKQTDAVWAFGTQCANVHAMVAEKLRKTFVDLSFDLTIGGVCTTSGTAFSYTKSEFIKHTRDKPNRFKGHAWITCGDRYIIDLTLGTYLINSPKRCLQYGPAIFGEPGALGSLQFKNGGKLSVSPIYNPVAVGIKALMDVSPTYAEWAASSEHPSS